jgi:hypothetical protein
MMGRNKHKKVSSPEWLCGQKGIHLIHGLGKHQELSQHVCDIDTCNPKWQNGSILQHYLFQTH